MTTLKPSEILHHTKPEAEAKSIRGKGRKLGAWVNGKLKYQSRDEESVHAYARGKLEDFRNSVWLAPVGSFQE